MMLLLLLFLIVTVSAYEDNTTNVGVYSNHISACNVNHATGNMLCINQNYESVIQYHDVRSTTFCPYHYCVVFNTEMDKLACSGYVFKKISASMTDQINPLTPNITNDRFTGNPDDDYVDVGTPFEGNNIFIDRFEQSVETYMGELIVEVACDSPLGTCVLLEDGSKNCFGGQGLVFHTMFESIVLGVIVPGLMAFGLYLALTFMSCEFASNGCVQILVVPTLVEIFCALILFVAPDFIVKVAPFLAASALGIALGKLSSNTITACFVRKPNIDYSTGERDGMLKNSTNARVANFEIGDDDDDDEDVTEIELGAVGVAEHVERV